MRAFLADNYGDTRTPKPATAAQQAALDAQATAAAPSIAKYQRAYEDDQAFRTQAGEYSVFNLTLSRDQLESYFKFLPPLTRGKVVPNGYPQHEEGFLTAAENYWPRIVTFTYYLPDTETLTWNNPVIVGRPWSEALLAAHPGLAKLPTKVTLTRAELLSSPGAQIVQSASDGNACGWFFPQYGIYASFAPHILFDRMIRAEQLNADPTTGYWQTTYNAWLEPSTFESVRDFAEVTLLAVGAAYAAAAVVGQGSAAAGATDASTLSDTTLVQAPAPVLEPLSTITPVDASALSDSVLTLDAGATGSGLAAFGTAAAETGIKVAGAVGAAEILGNERRPAAPPPSMKPAATVSATKKSNASELVLALLALGALAFT